MSAKGTYPEHWGTSRLESLLAEPLRNGHSARASKDGIGIRTLTLTAVTLNDFSERNTKLTVADPAKVGDLWLKDGDILVERSNTPELVGTANLYRGPEDYAIFPDLLIRVRLAPHVDARLIALFLQSTTARTYFQRAAQGIAGSMPKISQGTVEALEVPVPPSEEQRHIVEAIESYFTRLDDAVATLERVQRNLKRYRASVLNAAVEGRLVPTEAELARAEGRDYEPASVLLDRILAERRRRWEEAELAKMKAKGMTPKDDKWKAKYREPTEPTTADLPKLPEGWSWSTWEHVAERVTVGHVGKMKDQYLAEGVPFLRGGNVRANRYESDGLKYVSREFHEKLSKSSLVPGDVLIVRSGAVGTACVLPETVTEANCSDLVIVKQPTGVQPRFGAYYMNSLAQATVRSQQVGVALIHFNTKSAAALPIPVAPEAEQARIVTEVEKALSVIDELESEVALNVKRTARLRQGVLKWAFAGKLVDQDPSDEPAPALLARISVEREDTPNKKPKGRGRRQARSTKA